MCVHACTCMWAHATVVLKLKCGLDSLAGLDSVVSSKSVLSGTPEFAFLASSWDAGIVVQGLHELPGYRMETEINICSFKNVVQCVKASELFSLNPMVIA